MDLGLCFYLGLIILPQRCTPLWFSLRGTLKQSIQRRTSRSYRAFIVHQTNFLNTLNEKGPLEFNIQVEPQMISPEAYVSFSSRIRHSLIKHSTDQKKFSPSHDEHKTLFSNERYFVSTRCKIMLLPLECVSKLETFPTNVDL